MRLAALLLLLAGCASGVKPYADGGEGNLSIRTSSSARASLDVHSVDAQCRAQYLGSVDLDKPAVAVGVPAGRLSYLEFGFAGSGFFSRRTHTSRGTLLEPKPGARYEVDVTYRDDIYGVVLREKPARGAARELPLLDLGSCRPRAAR